MGAALGLVLVTMAPAGSSHIDFSLAVLTAAGGIAAFVRKKSVPSLLGGVGIGAAFAVSGYIINVGDGGHLGVTDEGWGGWMHRGAPTPTPMLTTPTTPTMHRTAPQSTALRCSGL